MGGREGEVSIGASTLHLALWNTLLLGGSNSVLTQDGFDLLGSIACVTVLGEAMYIRAPMSAIGDSNSLGPRKSLKRRRVSYPELWGPTDNSLPGRSQTDTVLRSHSTAECLVEETCPPRKRVRRI